jgi:hypothetical protein
MSGLNKSDIVIDARNKLPREDRDSFTNYLLGAMAAELPEKQIRSCIATAERLVAQDRKRLEERTA